MSPTMVPMRRFQVPAAVSGSFHHAVLGEITYSFPEGEVTPGSEQDEIALDLMLVPAGLATEVSPDPDAPEFVARGLAAPALAAPNPDEAPTPAGGQAPAAGDEQPADAPPAPDGDTPPAPDGDTPPDPANETAGRRRSKE